MQPAQSIHTSEVKYGDVSNFAIFGTTAFGEVIGDFNVCYGFYKFYELFDS
jgi:hypothetical protein